MKLEDQVCSFELAKRLYGLGVKQESLHRWQNPFNDDYWEATSLKKEYIEKNNPNPENYAAFTVAELGEMLPKKITINNVDYYFTQIPCRDLKTWSIFYRNDFCGMPNCDFYDENEANARAKMLIYLLENNLIKNEELK